MTVEKMTKVILDEENQKWKLWQKAEKEGKTELAERYRIGIGHEAILNLMDELEISRKIDQPKVLREFKIDKLHPWLIYRKTERMKRTPYSKSQPDMTVEGDYTYSSCEVQVTSIEDRGDFFYVGYTPLSSNHGAFGYTKIYKNGAPEYGTVGFEEV